MTGHHRNGELQARVNALLALAEERGIVDREEIDRRIETLDRSVSPVNGARMVVRAWNDDGYRERLLGDAGAAAAELGVAGGGYSSEIRLHAVANTPELHNVVVCTLCSCYPLAWLGPPPAWYKSEAYRSRVVRDPRGVLAEFGTTLPDDVEVRVWDASAEARYLVVPMAPDGVDALPDDEQLAVVTRDCLIGVAVPQV
ncbi:nitrile hydratase subunit alpha [Actinomycetospora sp. NBRC 106378]|uniref:nitrile hydratase subunit alpha n=1 Tax=Actinomycetospora sp. NBRC 106378 TaxID=3032208 RepID=UPI0024A39486|nr:nitrile hydratase subunit alpha [Actinomycetospora sp. NBRC 106378]GLZ53792.1 nitrile hydratase subunit alpha [Actinomycetospora sp. NBRC 106378]